VEGMMRGARIFGDKGCIGDPCLGVAFWLDSSLAIPVVLVSDIVISAFSSNAGPVIQDMLSANICLRQLFPGALIDRSCNGGRPGMVAWGAVNMKCT
jgi:hypothetical protein